MRWSNRHDDDNLKSLLRGEGGGRLGPALAELQEKAPEAPAELRDRVRLLAAEEPAEEAGRKPRLGRYRLSYARAGALAATVLVVAVAIPAIAAVTGDGGAGPSASSDAGSGSGSGSGSGGNEELAPVGGAPQDLTPPASPPPPALQEGAPRSALTSPPPAQRARDDFAAPSAGKVSPLPSANRAQDYSARIKLHVDGHGELSEAVQSAIRSTRQLGGYVTYVDYGTSGRRDGQAELAVRIPIGRVQTAVARFSELGTILEQQTEIRDVQGQIDRITRDIQARRDRIAKLEAELKDPTLSESERDRLEARLVQAKRGLANATRTRAGVLRQSSYAKLDLAFTTEESSEPAPPPSDLRRTLDDALGILGAELGVLIYILIAGAPFILLLLLGVLGARALRRGANARVLERA